MRDSKFIEQLRCRLVELGCPGRQMRRLIQEITDHREDLGPAAALKGLSGAEAETWVNTMLGDPRQLAEKQMTMLRRSSWFGRYSLISFFLLPLLTVPVLWCLLLAFDIWAGYVVGFGLDPKKFHAAADNPVIFHHLVLAFIGADYVTFGLLTLLFYWLARRAAVGWRWVWAACGVCLLYALFTWVRIKPHNFTIGLSTHPQWLQAVIPLLLVGALYTLQWRKVRNLRYNLSA